MNEPVFLTMRQRDAIAALVGAPVLRGAHRTTDPATINALKLRGLVAADGTLTSAGYDAAHAAGLLAQYDQRTRAHQLDAQIAAIGEFVESLFASFERVEIALYAAAAL